VAAVDTAAVVEDIVKTVTGNVLTTTPMADGNG